MIDLLEGPLPLHVNFVVSLPHSLLATISLVCASSEFEGLGDWLRETRARLPADLYEELCVLIGFPGHHQRFIGELSARLPDGAADLDYDELMAHLRAIPDVHYQLIALQALARGSALSPTPNQLLDLLDRPPEWAAYLAEVESRIAPETVATLVRDRAQLKSRLLNALERFWQEAYAREFEATRPLMERSVIQYRTVRHNSSFRQVGMPRRISSMTLSASGDVSRARVTTERLYPMPPGRRLGSTSSSPSPPSAGPVTTRTLLPHRPHRILSATARL